MSELQAALKGRVPAHVGLVTKTHNWGKTPWTAFYLRDYLRDEMVYLGRETPRKSQAATAELLGEIAAWRASR